MRQAAWRSARERLALLGELRAAGAPMVATLVALQLTERLVPAATALATARLISVSALPTGHPLLATFAVVAAVYGTVLAGGHLLEAASGPLMYAVKARIDGARRADLVRRVTACPTLEELERPQTQEQVRLARADPGNWTERSPGDGALTVLAMLTSLLGMVASCLVVARFAWWLIPVLVVPALCGRVMVSREGIAYFRQWRGGVRHGLRADLWAGMLSSPKDGKEVRLFGFATLAAGRMRGHILAMHEPAWAVAVRGMARNGYRVLLLLAGLGTAYAAVAVSAADGRTAVATEAATFAAAWSVFEGLFNYDPRGVLGAIPGQRAYRELARVLESPPAPAAPDTAGVAAQPPLVRFEAVRFAYPGTDRNVLEQVDLEIRPGELLAIVGLNGAGKSTLIKLLSGLYRPTAGRITADGQDIETIGPARWRTRIAVVFQDFVKYPLPLSDNVLLARAGLARDDAALTRAAVEAGLSEVIDRLPAGWDTPLSRSRRGGVDLSGGQWQQVALTRALYAARTGAGLLVLDEPTAHLDVRTEFEVFQRLASRRHDVSVVLISHRLSTVRQADRIVLLADGRVAESGSHAQLMAADGQYARLFEIQARRFAKAALAAAEGAS